MPKLHQLQAFHEIIRCGSIRSAAKVLGRTQPALTRTIRELEATLGVALLIRGTRGVVLTESGKLFAARTRFVLEEMQRAQEELKQLNAYSQGKVSFGFSSLIAFTILPAIIQHFRKKRPLASVLCKESQLSVLLPFLREGQMDFAIGSMSPDVPLSEFIEEPLFTAPFCVLARRGHPLAPCTTLQQLQQAQWILPETTIGYYKQVESYLGATDIAPLRTDSALSILNMVLYGDYLSVIAQAMAEPLGLKDSYCAVQLAEPLPVATYSLIYPRRTPLTETARLMIDIIRYHCKKYDWSGKETHAK